MEIIDGHVVDVIGGIEQSFDLLVSDPPYAFSGTGAEHALSAAVAVGLRESARKLKRGRWAVVFAASSWRSTYYVVESLRGVLEPVRIATWCKTDARTKTRTPGWAWASVNVIAFRHAKSAPLEPSLDADWITCAAERNGRRAQLPMAVAEWAVAPFVVPGGIAFDPFAGSGALLEAAEHRGMRCIGVEIRP